MKHGSSIIPKISAVAALVVGIVSIIFSWLGRSGYDPFLNYLSDLGIGGPWAVWFNTGMMAAGLLLFVFFVSLKRLGKGLYNTAGSVAGLVASVALVGVGVFPGSVAHLHTWSAGIFFLFSLTSALCLEAANYMMKPNKLDAGLIALLLVIGIPFVITDLPVLEHLVVVALWLWLAAFVILRSGRVA